MKALVLAGALALVSSSASAALLIDIHAVGTANGSVFTTVNELVFDDEPIIVDATFNLSKGVRLTGPVSDVIGGGGPTSPGLAVVDQGLLFGDDWGAPFSVLRFTHTASTSSMNLLLRDPTDRYLLELSVFRSDLAFGSLDTPPAGNVCDGASICEGGITDPDFGTTRANVGIDWSSITFSVRNTAVPEPATWGLMILGFGVAGSMLRKRRLVPN